MDREERLERQRAKDRERKARSRAKMTEAQLAQERAKARAAMAKKRSMLSEEERAAARTVARIGMKRLRDNMSDEERRRSNEKERARQAGKRVIGRQQQRQANNNNTPSMKKKICLLPEEINSSSSPQAINHNSSTGQNAIAAAAAQEVWRKEFAKSVHAKVLAKAGLIVKAALAKNMMAMEMNRAAAIAASSYCHHPKSGYGLAPLLEEADHQHHPLPPPPGPRVVSVDQVSGTLSWGQLVQEIKYQQLASRKMEEGGTMKQELSSSETMAEVRRGVPDGSDAVVGRIIGKTVKKPWLTSLTPLARELLREREQQLLGNYGTLMNAKKASRWKRDLS